tara:strand:+ start:300 stop:1238 length:939 start_codon:yes stop_codon:yes gene_type:complete
MTDEKKEALRMKFDPHTIGHLGANLYATLPPILAELVANSYDANATEVTIYLNDTSEEKTITVEDNGDGMTRKEVNEDFLMIGRNRREDGSTAKRRPIGKKGVGKLSFFGIAGEFVVETRKDNELTGFAMNHSEILEETEIGDYSPKELSEKEFSLKEGNGTRISLNQLKRKTNFDADGLARALCKYFIFDSDFQVFIKRNEKPPIEVNNDLRLDVLNVEFSWKIPEDIKEQELQDYFLNNGISGVIVTSTASVPPSTQLRGITLFSRTKLVNKPEAFGNAASNYYFSYQSGILNVDFVDNFSEDVISTNRQ